jgi:hypothetical protein
VALFPVRHNWVGPPAPKCPPHLFSSTPRFSHPLRLQRRLFRLPAVLFSFQSWLLVPTVFPPTLVLISVQDGRCFMTSLSLTPPLPPLGWRRDRRSKGAPSRSAQASGADGGVCLISFGLCRKFGFGCLRQPAGTKRGPEGKDRAAKLGHEVLNVFGK